MGLHSLVFAAFPKSGVGEGPSSPLSFGAGDRWSTVAYRQMSGQLGKGKWFGDGRPGEALIINPLDRLLPVSSSGYKRKLGAGLTVHRETEEGKVISCPTHIVFRPWPGICEAEVSQSEAHGDGQLLVLLWLIEALTFIGLPWNSDCPCACSISPFPSLSAQVIPTDGKTAL